VNKIMSLAVEAKNNKTSRAFVEAVAALDPVVADFVYIVDHKLAARGHDDPDATGGNSLNTWHSFGRPEIVRLQLAMCQVATSRKDFLMLPCSRRRPYGESRTHARLRRQLADAGYQINRFEQVVVTAIGVVPESHWREPLIMTYDAGAVDLWRVFQLLRKF